ncbi:hypothetical protein J4449_01935 [Candidatus Woesearchaeota archaeon]|nr:hypothetical protein [Candidatus Woesearchaeota archaeon]
MNGQYLTKELFAEEQPLVFVEKIKGYLDNNSTYIGGNSYFIDNGIISGVLILEEESKVTQKGIETNIVIGVTARKSNLDALVNELKTRFSQLKIKDSEKPI